MKKPAGSNDGNDGDDDTKEGIKEADLKSLEDKQHEQNAKINDVVKTSIKMLIENEMTLEECYSNLQDLTELGGSAQKVHSLLMETMLAMAKSINSHVTHMKDMLATKKDLKHLDVKVCGLNKARGLIDEAKEEISNVKGFLRKCKPAKASGSVASIS